jgi:SAM-dependent methyltransferase
MATMSEGVHLFISYCRRDAVIVTDVAKRLKDRGVDLYCDVLDDNMPGKRFLEVIELGLRRAGLVAVFIGPGGLGDIQRLEVNLAIILSAKRGLRVIPVLLPDVGPSPELELFLQCFSWIDLRKGVTQEEIQKLVRLCLPEVGPSGTLTPSTPKHRLASLLRGAQRRLVISGHTLDKFTRNTEVQEALLGLVRQGVSITILQLNPSSPYAAAHRAFHELESTSPADDQYEHTLNFLRGIFDDSPPSGRDVLDVSFTNYMPRFRTVIVDDSVYVYLYMYGSDVAESPDLCLAPSESAHEGVRQRILYSTLSHIYAPESIPFIRCGQIFPQWRDKHICTWSNWTAAERMRHKLTHDFYVNHAEVFDKRFGDQLEVEVRAHLDHTTGATLVLGCGSGKEVEYIASRRTGDDDVCGVDLSHTAIRLARRRSNPVRAEFFLCDFYDLDLEECLSTRLFDSVVANAAFVHLKQRDDIDSLLERVSRRLKPGGILFLRCLFKEQNGRDLLEEVHAPHTERWGWGRWFVYYSRTELVQRCERAGFRVDHRATEVIARRRNLKPRIALEKGFPHAEHSGVFWPCILARKRAAGSAVGNMDQGTRDDCR